MTLQRRTDEILEATPGVTWQEALELAANEKREDYFEQERAKHLTHSFR
jgi:hypothetical protein